MTYALDKANPGDEGGRRCDARGMRRAAVFATFVLAACAVTSEADPAHAPSPASSASATAVAPASSARPAAGAARADDGSIRPTAAGVVPDAGILYVQGPDDRIYRYDGRSGDVAAVWAASVFAGERADGALTLGRHGGAALLRWDGTVSENICGDGTVLALARNGACAFRGDGADGSISVRLVGRAKRLLLPADWRAGDLVWDPSGTRLALTRSLGGSDPATRLHDSLWIVSDGAPREIYRPAGDTAFVYQLRWSPDGRSITFRQQGVPSASIAADGVGLFVLDVDTGAVTDLGLVAGSPEWSQWSADGRLAFVRGGGRETWTNKRLVLRERDGTERQLSSEGRIGLAPAWDAMGGSLAWVEAEEGNGLRDSAYMNGTGPGAREAVVSPGYGGGPFGCGDRVVEGARWSADARQLLLLCRRPGDESHALEIWLRRLGSPTPGPVPLVTGLGDLGFGYYGTQPSLFSLVAWSNAVATPPTTLRPTGFVLPAACAYVTPGIASGARTLWQIDCGVQGLRDARGTLAPAFAAQGWRTCGPALATATWIKGEVALTVSEPSAEPVSYIGLTESPARIVTC